MNHILFLLVISHCTCIQSGALTAPDNPKTILNKPIDSIVVIKHQRQMRVYNRGNLLKSYHVCLGFAPEGAKHFRNDGKTPEGIYHINGKNPHSHYHKALGVSYPAAKDREYARRYGKPTGGDIKIHGLPNGYGHLAEDYVKEDWTLGCIALTDEEIDEVYKYTAVGTIVNILP
ncbi:MAG: hypothetical protein K0Q79_1156 [Flavipsychrobacter sp.]|jgi:murein L,D-transpeptidase YafK|nr:hypothetical protein [Flavipsychrobacter sp.]